MSVVVLATGVQPSPTEWVGAGLTGFAVIVALCVATYFLWRNMNKQLRRIQVEEHEPPRRRDLRRWQYEALAAMDDDPTAVPLADTPPDGGTSGPATRRPARPSSDR